jgi:hypothetical protein
MLLISHARKQGVGIMKSIGVALCILLFGLTAGCTDPGPQAYRSDQEKQPHYAYPPQMLRPLII